MKTGTMETRLMFNMTKKIAFTGLTALVAAAVTMPLVAQQATSAAKAPRVLIETEAEHRAKVAAESGKGADDRKPGSEGVQIHGHWTLDVKNPDGTLAEHRDFYNSLYSDGGVLIAGLMMGTFSPEYFDISLGSSGATIVILSPTGSEKSGCSIAANCPATLTQALVATTAGATYLNGILLSGQYTPTAAYVLSRVGTDQLYCQNIDPATQAALGTVSTVAPATCQGGTLPSTSNRGYNEFTHTTLTTPLSVSAGQTLAVTVTLSFS